MQTTQVDQLLASYMVNNPQGVSHLLTLNGVIVPQKKNEREIAFLKAIKDSDHFRSQLATELGMWQKSHFGFVDNSQYLNETGDAEPWLGGTASTTTTSTTTTTAPKKSWLGSIFTPDLIQSGIKTGLDSVSTSQKSKAQQQSEQNALELERLRLQQIEASKAGGASSAGMSTTAKVLIGIGTAIVVGGMIYMIIKMRKKG